MWWWWHMSLILALRRQEKGRRFSEFKATLVYRECSRAAKAKQRNSVFKNKNKETEKRATIKGQ